jgi:hypothetical protein
MHRMAVREQLPAADSRCFIEADTPGRDGDAFADGTAQSLSSGDASPGNSILSAFGSDTSARAIKLCAADPYRLLRDVDVFAADT